MMTTLRIFLAAAATLRAAFFMLAGFAPVPARAAQQTAAPQTAPCAGLPPGRHAVLEGMTANFGLTCEQELQIEPLLHAEESVTKPLLKYSSLTPEEEQGIMLTIKLAARRQIRGLLTPEQQKKSDQDSETVARGGGRKGGGKKGTPKKESEPVTAANALDDEESLSKAIVNYAALTPDEKKSMLVQVKQAARRDANLPLTTGQRTKLDAEIQDIKSGK